jgi:hypothetical protein
MESAMKFAICVAVATVLACPPARAEEEFELDIDMSRTLICDTQMQTERFVALFAGDVGATLHAVNSEQDNPTACDIATIAYFPSDDVATAKGPCGHFRVVKILLIGVLTEEEGFLFTVPAPYFTMLPAGENISRLRGRLDELPKHASAVPSATECSLEKHRKDEPGR